LTSAAIQQLEARLNASEEELAGLQAAASKHAEMIAMIHSMLHTDALCLLYITDECFRSQRC
jgi:hypothetical protein